jgi:hypothetical protein
VITLTDDDNGLDAEQILDDYDDIDVDTRKTTLHGAAICGDTIRFNLIYKHVNIIWQRYTIKSVYSYYFDTLPNSYTYTQL